MNQTNMKKSPMVWPVVLSVIGVVMPILWDVFRNNSALELEQIGRTVLIRKNDAFEKLDVTYGGRSIDELSSVSFRLTNSGSTPILDSDIVTAPTIYLPVELLVLDVQAGNSYPDNLDASLTMDHGKNKLSVGFPLLNPGDNFQFSLVVESSSPIDIKADARIAGLSKLKFITLSEEPAQAERHISWIVYPVGGFSFFLLGVAMFGLLRIPKELSFKKRLRNKQFFVPESLTHKGAKGFVLSELSWTTRKERSSVIAYIDNLRPSDPIQKDVLEQLVIKCSVRAVSNVSVVLVVFAISGGGMFYVIPQLL